MSQQTAPGSTPGPTPGPGRAPGPESSPWAAGGTAFAGVLMLVSGVIGALQGIAGIAKDDVYTRLGDYVFAFNLTTWGWIHLLLGLAVAATGYGILKGQDWARGAGIAMAAVYVVAYFLFLPYAPVWSVIVIAMAVFVMWALATAVGSGDGSKDVG